ncbi:MULTISPECIES: sugar ABC transporter permease [unclassified Fusibacter]|uniref:sugar ABC transporter permease n=1 Tax=unclassified Fusibacter TaxID=2624464 RepID=UPI001010A59C|nr:MULTISPECIES: sugar ABC transporter permease [unclassified Fusibacter]MCK8059046.1 sugar ABC transporter permease [Fusibacter sp. A2]NPE22457.1 sugar ABC transporter permease [Fusibacter sp. A1]RXV60561.1 sugar ABC transporter permease [Fusibacter sp. A1]
MDNLQFKKLLKKAIMYALLLMVTFIFIVPSIWIVGSSFNQGTNIFSTTLIPKNPTLFHYKELLFNTDYPLWFGNTLKIATLNMLLSLVLTISTAMAFSRFKFKGKKITMMTILILQMFPSMLAMMALYVILNRFGLLNTHLGLVIVYATGQIPFNTWLVKGYLDAIPKSLDEAARIDGASNITIVTKVVLPLAKPILVFVALQNFIGPWFDFVLPQVILRSQDKWTLALGLFRWVADRAQNNFTMFAAGAVLVTIPITILWAIFQKHIVEGLAAGASKG